MRTARRQACRSASPHRRPLSRHSAAALAPPPRRRAPWRPCLCPPWSSCRVGPPWSSSGGAGSRV
eukprot:2619055-Pleurochrysis_carterae.AAC.1